MLPRLATLRSERPRALRFTSISATALFSLSLLYMLGLLFNLATIQRIVLGEEYANHSDIASLSLLWCLVMCTQVVQASVGALVQAMKLFRQLAYADFLAGSLGLVSAIASIVTFGVPGAVVGTLVGEAFLLFLLVRFARTSA
jgi:O-antigen/teichoic acid export membrane protein